VIDRSETPLFGVTDRLDWTHPCVLSCLCWYLIMVEPGRTSARVVQVFGQPVRLTALLQTAATAAVTMTTSQSSHSKVSSTQCSLSYLCCYITVDRVRRAPLMGWN